MDIQATEKRCEEIHKERVERVQPVSEWMKSERERILRKETSVQVQHMFATSLNLSSKFENKFRKFWNLPPE